MKKTVYVVTSERIDGDSYDLYVTLDKEEAIEWAKDNREGLSAYDRKRCTHGVYGYEIEVEEGQSINEAYHEYVLNSFCIYDPVDYVKITIEGE